eukprot:372280_1
MALFVLMLILSTFVITKSNTFKLGDVPLRPNEVQYYLECDLAIVSGGETLTEAIIECNKQTYNGYNGENKECYVGGNGCQEITNGELQRCANPSKRKPFIYDLNSCSHEDICPSTSSAWAFDMALLPSSKDIKTNELVCIEYKYYMAICILLMIAFASFLCFIVVALNKLKQLRDRSVLYF